MRSITTKKKHSKNFEKHRNEVKRLTFHNGRKESGLFGREITLCLSWYIRQMRNRKMIMNRTWKYGSSNIQRYHYY